MKEKVSSSIIRRRKHGFTVPLKEWFDGELGEYAKTVLDEKNIKKRSYFNHRYTNKILKKCDKPDQTKQVWHILMLELWHQKYVDKIDL